MPAFGLPGGTFNGMSDSMIRVLPMPPSAVWLRVDLITVDGSEHAKPYASYECGELRS